LHDTLFRSGEVSGLLRRGRSALFLAGTVNMIKSSI
jgi:hypothetical protein